MKGNVQQRVAQDQIKVLIYRNLSNIYIYFFQDLITIKINYKNKVSMAVTNFRNVFEKYLYYKYKYFSLSLAIAPNYD